MIVFSVPCHSASFLKHLPVVELHLGSFEAITLIFLFVELTSNQRIRLEKPSTAPWTKKPKGANLPIRQRAIRSLARGWLIFVSLAYVFDDVPLLQGLKSEVWSPKSLLGFHIPQSYFHLIKTAATKSVPKTLKNRFEMTRGKQTRWLNCVRPEQMLNIFVHAPDLMITKEFSVSENE